ncbi:MAG: hypothetical protein JWM19_2768 [Actinomycetia bacterium]|nr:hypothetical protein [Actinomycetes bacterium]
MAEYADAGIPFYWLGWLSGNHVRIQVDWNRLTNLVRQ